MFDFVMDTQEINLLLGGAFSTASLSSALGGRWNLQNGYALVRGYDDYT